MRCKRILTVCLLGLSTWCAGCDTTEIERVINPEAAKRRQQEETMRQQAQEKARLAACVTAEFPDCLTIESASLKTIRGVFGEYVEVIAHDQTYRYVLRGGVEARLPQPGDYAARINSHRIEIPGLDTNSKTFKVVTIHYQVTHIQPR